MKKHLQLLLLGAIVWIPQVSEAQNATFIKPLPQITDAIDYQQNTFTWKDHLYFRNNGVLYKSDGSTSGTTVLIDSLSPHGEIAVTDTCLYFFRTEGAKGYSFWKSKGDVAHTSFITKVTNSNTVSDEPGALRATANGLYFTTQLSSQAWKSDGTSAGTRKFYRANYLHTYAPRFGGFIAFGNKTVISVMYPYEYRYLIVTDGTTVEELAPLGYNDIVSNIIKYKDKAYFLVNNSTTHAGLWETDGTKSGTKITKVFPQYNAIGERIDTLNGELIFKYNNAPWMSDGTAANTRQIGDMYGFNNMIYKVNGKILSFNSAGSFATEVWEIDGVSEDSVLYDSKEFGINATITMAEPLGNKLYFYKDLFNDMLYETDGTETGLRGLLISQLDDCADCMGLLFMRNYKGALYFYVNNGSKTGLWRLNEIATGVADQTIKDEIQVYPNPSSGLVHVDTKGPARLMIYNSQGISVADVSTSQSTTLQLDKGVYILKIEKGTELITRKLVIE
jgi:hypothetical protein